jgi:hypothetical protein
MSSLTPALSQRERGLRGEIFIESLHKENKENQ